MNKGLTKDNMLRTFPYVLSRDKTKMALASSVAQELQYLCADDDKLTIYTNLNKLDETLLDILAKDYKVDWYLYDGTLESKRSQIESSFYVHRHLGTKGAMMFALSDLCPGTEVEEWFEYNGRPYYFRVILDVTEQRIPISQDIAEKVIMYVKPCRAVLEEDSIIYRSRETILVGVSSNYVLYSVRICGTYPHAAVQGRIGNENIEIVGVGNYTNYTAPMTDMLKAGTFPEAAVHGRIGNEVIDVNGVGDSAEYAVAMTGTVDTGTVPVGALRGGIEGDAMSMEASAGSTSYSSRMCGTALDSIL